MADLIAIINRDKRRVLFQGSGTFHAKEKIKELGTARWDGSLKAWAVENFLLSDEELLSRFPSIVLKQETNKTEPTPVSKKVEIAAVPSAKDIPEGLSVSQFVGKVRSTLSKKFSGGIYIFGIISSIKSYGNRFYIDLNDSEAADVRISCVIWENAAGIVESLKKAGFELEKDLQVMFEATVSVNPKDGRLSLSISRVVPEYTLAKIAALREQTNIRLQSEGIFSKNQTLKLPYLPRRLGLLTSSGGTVINDFRASLDQASFGFELYWYHASVQGSEAKEQIIRGLKVLESINDLDAILIFRGGGSQAELSIFNDYAVARAVCNCKLPVLSAIGHQQDQCSVQDVSFKAFGVPKDLGRFFADIVVDFRIRLKESIQLINTIGKASFNDRFNQFKASTKPLLTLALARLEYQELLIEKFVRIVRDLGSAKVTNLEDTISSWTNQNIRLGSGMIALSAEQLKLVKFIIGDFKHLLEFMAQKLEYISLAIASADPQNQLKRGFVLLRSVDQKRFITKAEQLKEQGEADLQFVDSVVRISVKNK